MIPPPSGPGIRTRPGDDATVIQETSARRAALLLIDPGLDTDLLGIACFAVVAVSQYLRKVPTGSPAVTRSVSARESPTSATRV